MNDEQREQDEGEPAGLTWKQRNPEKNRECARKWALANPEKVREKRRKYYLANPEKQKENTRKRHLANPDKVKEQNRKYYLANPGRTAASTRKRKYGKMPGFSYVETIRLNPVCQACGTKAPSSKRQWHIDHCHTLNVVRGLLCHHCNTALGLAQDSIPRLEALIAYLRDPPALRKTAS